MKEERVTTGLKRLDSLMGGGLPSKTAVLLSGGPGTGKTLVGLNFLIEGAKKGERCCYITLNEGKGGLVRACMGIKSLSVIDKYIDRNLAIESIQLSENLNVKKFVNILSNYPRLDRLVIDNLNKLLLFSESSRMYRMRLSGLIRYVRENVGCALLVCETKDAILDTDNSEAFESDGILHLSFLELEEMPKRMLEIIKMRYTSFEPRVGHEFVVDKSGLRLSGVKAV